MTIRAGENSVAALPNSFSRDTAIQDVGPSYEHGDEAGVQLPVKRTSRLAAYPSLGIRET